ncbi:MAG: cellobiose phosphorylase [Candidatus Ventricola sp.]
MFDAQNRFVISDYQKKPPFSSFLPGIAGPLGVPVWCYYNNRGQAVCSFGAQDRDHAIMEFRSAHDAYQTVRYLGFRTFCKADGRYEELFTDHCDMHIGMSEVEITAQSGPLAASAVYYGVPGLRTAALARILTVRNTGDTPLSLELLDGMPALVPYGVSQDTLKTMSNLAKAWMQVEDVEAGRAYFRLRASMADTAKVTAIEGGNFCLGWDETGARLVPLVQPSLVFAMDTSLTKAEGFRSTPLKELCTAAQTTQNLFPCCFLPREARLAPGGEIRIFSLYGQAECKEQVCALAQSIQGTAWFEEKRREAQALVERLCAPVSTRTADPVFDAYCAQTYLDNLLRGGVPIFFCSGGQSVPYYLYARKHGDPEREYNYFSLGREYYAQGNGNFRDINQNRRSDVRFAPALGAENIHTFFDLIQTDGYNPLVLTASTYSLPAQERAALSTRFPKGVTLFSGSFTPGQLAMAAEDWGMDCREIPDFMAQVLCRADSEPNADFSEGYWCDHWTYNLDLVESYLSVYPDKREELLFGQRRYRYYETRMLVNPRTKRYCITENGLRQYHALTQKPTCRKWMETADGVQARSTLMEKLLLLCAIKTATLDPEGMGVEMEGGKPGWYDALNGLPGLLGSSMAETCELARLLDFTIRALDERDGSLDVYAEIEQLLTAVEAALLETDVPVKRWDRLNGIRERYREETAEGYCGARISLDGRRAADSLRILKRAVEEGIQRAVALGGGLIPTYFAFEATEIEEKPDGPMPTAFRCEALPLFLEGPVRYLKLALSHEEKQDVANRIRSSALYDEALHMFKVNASLEGVSYEAGRARAFTPGWLENESIWLHMEYKYLLELLKSGLYAEFSRAFRSAAVPFLNPEQYGRSPLENVSFLASSANPDPDTHGRGYVARLSGSTAEFLQMWQIMFFGMTPFFEEAGQLRLRLNPFVPEVLMPEDGIVQAVFLGTVAVSYHSGDLAALVPGKTAPVCYTLAFEDGKEKTVHGDSLGQEDALAVREGRIQSIRVTMR